MKKLITIFAAILCIGGAAVSCDDPIEVIDPVDGREEVKPVPVPDSVTFTVSLEQDGTKTSLNGTQVLWTAGDKIKVFNASNPTGIEYTLVGSGGVAEGLFSGPVMTGSQPYFAVYPSSSAESLSGSTLNLAIPYTQTCVNPGDTFGAGANVSVGRSETLEHFTFKNLFGVLQLQVTDNASDIDSVVVYTKGETDVLHGNFSVTFDSEGIPSAVPASGQIDEIHQKVKLVCRAGGALDRYFYIVLPEGTIDAGMTIELHDSSGKAQIKNAGLYSGEGHRITRSHIRPMPGFDYTAQFASSFLTCQQTNAVFVGNIAQPGIAPVLHYNPATSQYAYKNVSTGDGSRYLRIQDWSAGYAMDITLESYTIEGGQIVGANMHDYANPDYSSYGIARILKKTLSRIWLVGYENYALDGGILMNITATE